MQFQKINFSESSLSFYVNVKIESKFILDMLFKFS
jgi:hypothetical protein